MSCEVAALPFQVHANYVIDYDPHKNNRNMYEQIFEVNAGFDVEYGCTGIHDFPHNQSIQEHSGL